LLRVANAQKIEGMIFSIVVPFSLGDFGGP
jgi:hypothetical protein